MKLPVASGNGSMCERSHENEHLIVAGRKKEDDPGRVVQMILQENME